MARAGGHGLGGAVRDGHDDAQVGPVLGTAELPRAPPAGGQEHEPAEHRAGGGGRPGARDGGKVRGEAARSRAARAHAPASAANPEEELASPAAVGKVLMLAALEVGT